MYCFRHGRRPLFSSVFLLGILILSMLFSWHLETSNAHACNFNYEMVSGYCNPEDEPYHPSPAFAKCLIQWLVPTGIFTTAIGGAQAFVDGTFSQHKAAQQKVKNAQRSAEVAEKAAAQAERQASEAARALDKYGLATIHQHLDQVEKIQKAYDMAEKSYKEADAALHLAFGALTLAQENPQYSNQIAHWEQVVKDAITKAKNARHYLDLASKDLQAVKDAATYQAFLRDAQAAEEAGQAAVEAAEATRAVKEAGAIAKAAKDALRFSVQQGVTKANIAVTVGVAVSCLFYDATQQQHSWDSDGSPTQNVADAIGCQNDTLCQVAEQETTCSEDDPSTCIGEDLLSLLPDNPTGSDQNTTESTIENTTTQNS